MASRLEVKWMNDKGKEVAKEEATHALVATYDAEGQLVDESFGTVEPENEVADQEQA